MNLTLAQKIKRLVEYELWSKPGLVCHPIKNTGYSGLVCRVKVRPRVVKIMVNVGIIARLNIEERRSEIQSMLYWACINTFKFNKPIDININFKFFKF